MLSLQQAFAKGDGVGCGAAIGGRGSQRAQYKQCEDIWKKLSEVDKKIILDAAAKAQVKDRELVRTQTEEYIEELEEEGMTVTYPDLEEFKAATSNAVDVFADTYDAKLLDKIR